MPKPALPPPRWWHTVYWRAHRPRVIRDYLSSQRVRKLQIGAGPHRLEGWLSTNLDPRNLTGSIFLDATTRFPFEDCCFDYIFSEHVIEHFGYVQGQSMLRESYRTLKPGGTLRVATPDLAVVLGLYTTEKTDVQERYARWIMARFLPEIGTYRDAFVINNAFHNWGHQFLYDEETLRAAMEGVGFVDVIRCVPADSQHEHLRGLESHNEDTGGEELNRFETMVLEAQRPR